MSKKWLSSSINEKLAIVTVTYNSSEVIDEFLQSIMLQDYCNYHLYIIDNNSTDASCYIIEQYATKLPLSLSKAPANLGFAKAANIGINQAINAGYQLILLTNNDILITAANFLRLLQQKLDESGVDIVAPKIFYCQDSAASNNLAGNRCKVASARNKIWYAGGGFNCFKAMGNEHYGLGLIDNGQFAADSLVRFAPMCCVLLKASCFAQIGYLDEKFFVYYEDADWFYRAKKAKLKLLYTATIALYHKVSSTTGGNNSEFSAEQLVKNRVYFVRKHFSYIVKYSFLVYIMLSILLKFFMPSKCIRKLNFKQRLKLLKIRLHAYIAGFVA